MSEQPRFAVRQPEGKPIAATAVYGEFPRAIRVAARTRNESLLDAISLRRLPADAVVIALYVALSRAFIGDEATLGIKIGPLPLYVTDAILLVLIAINSHERGGRLLHWLFSGGGAGNIGRSVWLLFLIAVLYCVIAFPQYQIMALHDLAIFGYCIFFPLTYFAVTKRAHAAKLVRYSLYATVLGALLFNFQTLTGVQLFSLGENLKGLPGHRAVAHLGANNLGAALGPALAGLLAYIAVQREHRLFHAGALLLCLATLAQLMDRSAFLGFLMAASLMFIVGVGRSRRYLGVLAAGLCLLLLVAAQGALPIPGGARLQNFWLSVSSGADIQNDPDGRFRLQRWHKTVSVWMTSPVLGVGFGAPIMVDTEGENLRGEKKGAAARGALGAFNVGMPHNTFLMVGARTGIIGLSLVCFAWLSGIGRIVKLAIHKRADADQIASAGVLVAMIGTAALNLFFERPMLCAPFWIMLAASYKLSENVSQQISGRAAAAAMLLKRFPQPLSDRYRAVPQNQVGGWQARWR